MIAYVHLRIDPLVMRAHRRPANGMTGECLARARSSATRSPPDDQHRSQAAIDRPAGLAFAPRHATETPTSV